MQVLRDGAYYGYHTTIVTLANDSSIKSLLFPKLSYCIHFFLMLCNYFNFARLYEVRILAKKLQPEIATCLSVIERLG